MYRFVITIRGERRDAVRAYYVGHAFKNKIGEEKRIYAQS